MPSLAVSVRRLHDTDRRWWWLLLPLAALLLGMVLPLATGGAGRMPVGVLFMLLLFGSLVALLVIFCREGTQGPNRFGPDPKDPAGSADLAEVFR